MARLAIFIDGGYIDKISWDEFGVRPDFDKLRQEIVAAVRARTADPIDLLRTFYYHCPPYQSNPPTREEADRFARSRSFYQALRRLPGASRFARVGSLIVVRRRGQSHLPAEASRSPLGA